MRCASKNLSLIYFQRVDDTPYIHAIGKGYERITWNTAKQAVAIQKTSPMPRITRPLRTPHAVIEQDWREEDAWGR